jgi:hypothetical protein
VHVLSWGGKGALFPPLAVSIHFKLKNHRTRFAPALSNFILEPFAKAALRMMPESPFV